LGKEVTQPPPPSEVKKSNRLIPVAIVMLLVGVAIGVAVGWSIGQSQSHAVQSEYTRVQVFSGSLTHATLNNYTYTFLYKWWGGASDLQKPIEIDVQGIEKTLPATQGQTYDILGIEVVVSEVHDDYIILLVKPL
jgi:uncharacterized protein HemX